MEKKLVYQSPIVITEILADDDILTLSQTASGVIEPTEWRP